MVDGKVIEHHFRYTAWASGRLLEAAELLTGEELNRDFGTSDKSVLGTLTHTFAGDRIWLARMSGPPPTSFIGPEDRDLAVLRKEWPIVHEKWLAWLSGVTDFTKTASYKDLKGNPYSQPLWQILLHVINHGTHHRGQVSGFMRSMGKAPPPTDLIYYYRELK